MGEVKKIKILTLRINMANLDYEKLIGEWHRDRNLIDGSTDKDQYMKLIQKQESFPIAYAKVKTLKTTSGI